MFVAEKNIVFIDGLIKKNTKYHIISQIRVDFINKEIEVQICHFSSKDCLDLTKSDYISSYLLNVDNLTDTNDLIIQCWIAIAKTENSIFENASLQEIDNA